MKKFKLTLCALLIMSLSVKAQVSVNVNIGVPPVWAPVERVETQYYYLPDIDTYYDVPSARFIYIKNGKWFRSAALPYRFKNYKLRGANVIFLTDYVGDSPYSFNKKHKIKYLKKMKYKEPKFIDQNQNEGNEYDKEERKEKKNGKGKGHKK